METRYTLTFSFPRFPNSDQQLEVTVQELGYTESDWALLYEDDKEQVLNNYMTDLLFERFVEINYELVDV